MARGRIKHRVIVREPFRVEGDSDLPIEIEPPEVDVTGQVVAGNGKGIANVVVTVEESGGEYTTLNDGKYLIRRQPMKLYYTISAYDPEQRYQFTDGSRYKGLVEPPEPWKDTYQKNITWSENERVGGR